MTMILNYMGSKVRMMPTLDKIISPLIDHVHADKKRPVVFGDLFAGSGSVSYFFKKKPKVGRVVASDIELYSYIINNALLKCVYNERLSKAIAYLNGPDLKVGRGKLLIWRHFAPNCPDTEDGRRMYFTLENAKRIDAMRQAITRMYQMGTVTYREFLFLLASLMGSCSKYANVASCFRAYLKAFSDRSKKRFVLSPIHMDRMRPASKQHSVVKNSCTKVAQKEAIDIAYLDPPYNANHYGGYYSFYNYLAVYSERYRIRGVSGVTSHYNKSDFGLKASARQALTELVSNMSETVRYLVMSYNSDGVLSKDEIMKIFAQKGDITLYKMWNKKFKPHAGVKDNLVKEYVFVVDCNRRGNQMRSSSVQEVWWEMQQAT